MPEMKYRVVGDEPEGLVAAPVGSIARDFTTGLFYIKLSGGSTAYGWAVLGGSGDGLPEPGMYNVRDYGAVGDGTTDDTAAIRTAYNELAAALDNGQIPGGTLYFPAGDYLMDDYESSLGTGGIQWLVLIKHDNVTVKFAPGAVISSNAANPGAGFVFFAYGGFKDVNPTSSDFFDCRYPWLTYVSMTAADKGDESVTVSDGSTFQVGDWILIKTGDVSNASLVVDPLLALPDQEINRITAKAGNVLQLRWPLSKPYAQEKYIDPANLGQTSIDGDYNDAPLGVARISHKTLHNLTFDGINCNAPNAVGLVTVEQAVNITMRNIVSDYGWTGLSAQQVRNVRMTDWILNKTSTPTDGGYPVAVAFGSNDCELANGIAYGLYPPMLHIREGCAGVNMHDIISKSRSSPNSGDRFMGLSIGGRAYDVQCHDLQLAGGSPGDYLVTIGVECETGGEIYNCHFGATQFTASIGCAGKHWRIHDNYLEKPVVNVDRTTLVYDNFGPGAPQPDSTRAVDSPFLAATTVMYLGGTDALNPGSTPSVWPDDQAAYAQLQFAIPTSAVTITDFTDAVDFQRLSIFFNNANTTIQHENGGNISLATEADWTPIAGAFLHLIRIGGVWYEEGRVERV